MPWNWTIRCPVNHQTTRPKWFKFFFLRFGVQIARDSHGPRATHISHVGAVWEANRIRSSCSRLVFNDCWKWWRNAWFRVDCLPSHPNEPVPAGVRRFAERRSVQNYHGSSIMNKNDQKNPLLTNKNPTSPTLSYTHSVGSETHVLPVVTHFQAAMQNTSN